MIVLQVAAGIILAYIVIVNQRVALNALKVIGAVLLFCLLAAIAFYTISIAIVYLGETIGPKLSARAGRIVSDFSMLVFVFFALGSGLTGGYCLSVISYKRKGVKPPADPDNHPYFGWSLLNLIFVLGVLGLLSLTPLDISGTIDAWSRENGYKDTGGFVLIGVLLPWPALWLWLLNRRKPEAPSGEPEEPSAKSSSKY
jgi:hypothetical protein